jgi:hypothetical protein
MFHLHWKVISKSFSIMMHMAVISMNMPITTFTGHQSAPQGRSLRQLSMITSIFKDELHGESSRCPRVCREAIRTLPPGGENETVPV